MNYTGGIRTYIDNTSSIEEVSCITILKLMSKRESDLAGEVVICHSYFELLIMALIRGLKGFNVVFIMHSMPRNVNLKNNIKYSILAKVLSVSKTKVIFPSSSAAKIYGSLGINGFTLCHYIARPSATEDRALIDDLPEHKVFRFLFAGRICKERFFPELLEIFSKDLAESPLQNIELLIAGSGQRKDIEVLRADKYSNVTYLGNLPQQAVRNIDYDCLISLMSSSRPETFGFAIGEAVMANKCIICNANAGILEHTKANNIFAVSHVNKDSVKSAIIQVLKFAKTDELIGPVFLNPEIEDPKAWVSKFKKIVIGAYE